MMKLKEFAKRLGLASTLTLSLATPTTQAMGPGMPGPMLHPGHLMHLMDELDVSESQRDQLFAVVDEYQPQLRKLMFAHKDTRDALVGILAGASPDPAIEALATAQGQNAAQTIRLSAAMLSRISALLTPAQRSELGQLLQNSHRHFRRPAVGS